MPESAARCRKENAAAERREARRWAYPTGDLRRSGDRPCREAGHGVRRFRTSACRRSAPLVFLGSEKRQGHPPPIQPGRRSVGLFDHTRSCDRFIPQQHRIRQKLHRKPDHRGGKLMAWETEQPAGDLSPDGAGRAVASVDRSRRGSPSRARTVAAGRRTTPGATPTRPSIVTSGRSSTGTSIPRGLPRSRSRLAR